MTAKRQAPDMSQVSKNKETERTTMSKNDGRFEFADERDDWRDEKLDKSGKKRRNEAKKQMEKKTREKFSKPVEGKMGDERGRDDRREYNSNRPPRRSY